MPTMEVEFEVFCKCGHEMCNETDVIMAANGEYSIHVATCPRCIERITDAHKEEFEELQSQLSYTETLEDIAKVLHVKEGNSIIVAAKDVYEMANNKGMIGLESQIHYWMDNIERTVYSHKHNPSRYALMDKQLEGETLALRRVLAFIRGEKI